MGMTWKECDGKTDRVVFEVIRCTLTADGKKLPVPDIRVNTWRTSLKLSANEVSAIYYDHYASEQHHSEKTSSLDLERLLNGKSLQTRWYCRWRWWLTTCCGCATSRPPEDHFSCSSRIRAGGQEDFSAAAAEPDAGLPGCV